MQHNVNDLSTNKLTMGSLFDGIGGFPLAATRCGVEPLWASEIEAFPIEVTKVRFPNMLHVGDITKLDGASLPPVNIICGGSPCQDLSVAGARRGLEGDRSGLFMEQIRITKELRDADLQRGRTALLIRPRWFIWENVPGAFSSGTPKYEDFRIVLEEVVGIKGSCSHVPGPYPWSWQSAGRTILGTDFSLAWRVFDTQYWPRTPQRRRRIFLVADFAGLTAPQILFKQDCLPGYPAKGIREGKELPAQLKIALMMQAGLIPLSYLPLGMKAYHINQRDEGIDLHGVSGALMATNNMQMQTFVTESPRAFAANQRDEVRDLHNVAGALSAQPGTKQQTFIAGFSAGAGASAGGIGYSELISPTLKGTASGNCMPSVLCLNDQGGNCIECSEGISGTLRAQEHGHQPLVLSTQHDVEARTIGENVASIVAIDTGSEHSRAVLFENHGIDSRYRGPLPIAPTMSARYGTGGNNVPLIAQPESPVYCITGNAIDRQPQNGGNGIGYQMDLAYTLTATDHHAVFNRQRVDAFSEDNIASTESARQGKDATDLVCQASDGNEVLLIRRLTPLECERLQGFPDSWTDLPEASDSARYKALGNSVAIPCVEFIVRGIVMAAADGTSAAALL